MAAGHGYPVAGGGQGKMRAADADRDQVAGILSTAYSEGRLSRDEYDAACSGRYPRAPTPTWTMSWPTCPRRRRPGRARRARP